MSTSTAPRPSPPPAADVDGPRTWANRLGRRAHPSQLSHRLVGRAGIDDRHVDAEYAQSWLVFDLTKSNLYLGIDDFLSQLPILLLTLIGGVIADRHDRRRLLTGSQYVQAFSAFSLALLVWTGHINIWFIFALSFISGCGQAFGGPAYQALIPSLVPRRDLPNAIALNSTQFNLSRVLGPVAGGAVLMAVGAAGCFAVNGASFFLVVFALAALHLPAHVPSTTPRALGEELRGGLHYVRDNRVLMILTALAFVTTFLAMPVSTLLPTFATSMHDGGGTPQTRLWMLMACQGLGAILGALIVGSLGLVPSHGTRAAHCADSARPVHRRLRGVALAAVEPGAALLRRHLLDGRVLDELFAAAADGARRAPRPRGQHLHGRAPRRLAARRSCSPARSPTRSARRA